MGHKKVIDENITAEFVSHEGTIQFSKKPSLVHDLNG